MNADVRIGDMRIRVPGVSPEAARTLAERVARRLSETLPSRDRSQDLGEIRVRVAVPEGASHRALVDAVSRAIAEALR